jgi:opacity protein-like surface antigen
MAGARGSIKIGRFREFGQFLVGAARVNGTAFGFVSSRRQLATQAGGGADFAFTPRVAVRAQVDYRAIRASESGGGTGHQIRALAAIVYTLF